MNGVVPLGRSPAGTEQVGPGRADTSLVTPPILASQTTGPRFRKGLRGKAAMPDVAPAPAPSPAQSSPELNMLMLRRAAYGPTPQTLAEINAIGATAWLERQLNPAGIADPDGDAVTALYPELSWDVSQARANLTEFSGSLLYAMLGNTIGRSVWSSRQLHEVMTAFWSNHLHVQGPFYDAWDTRHEYDQKVIRPNALGSFRQMLQASTRHTAMQRYLDQNNSTATRINENLGRELLELHTVGVGNHTEADMLASARMLTGVSINTKGFYEYRPANHHVGPLTILGRTFANASAQGEGELTAYLDFLARHPKTAERIARKLVVRFVSDNPPAALVDRLAAIYLSNDTAITPVLRALFTSAEFASSTGQKIRTPQEDMYAMIRALGITVARTKEELQSCYWALGLAGHSPMDWATPDGFPDEPGHFATPAVAIGRMNLHTETTNNWWPKLSGYPTPAATGQSALRGLLPAQLPATHGEMVQALAQRVLFTTLDDTALNAVLTYLGTSKDAPVTEKSPAVTWRLGHLTSLLFDSTAHAIR